MHKLEGTARKDRAKRHPQPTSGTPVLPGPLTGAGRREWNRIIKELRGTEMLAKVDGAMLYGYCRLYHEVQGVQADLRRLERAARRRNVDQVEILAQRNKLRTQARQHWLAIRAYLVEFGLSPAARTRVELSPAGGDLGGGADEFAEFDRAPELKLVHGKKR